MKMTPLTSLKYALVFALLTSLLLITNALPATQNESDSTITNHYNSIDNATSSKEFDTSEKLNKAASTQLKGESLEENKTTPSSESRANNEYDALIDHPIKPIGESKEDGLIRVDSPRFSKVILGPSPAI